MIEGASKQILLIAPDLLGETLSLQLTAKNKSIEVFLRQKYLTRHPSLVIWSIDSLGLESTTRNEIKGLAKTNNINCIDKIIHKNEVDGMDEAFICSSAIGILPCYWDDWESDYKITKRLQFLLEESLQK